ncbi:MAG: GNAT family N-acetyltransferase [Sphingobacteriales bacterium]|nr:GNAT family N-acetyltransferase [Sphingobacteriales bacterium]
MKHPLDQPIYAALQTAHQSYALGDQNACFYRKDIANFAGLKNYDEAGFKCLDEFSESGMLHILFSPVQLSIPSNWKKIRHIDMFQLVYESDQIPAQKKEVAVQDLTKANVAEMLALVELTQPGPFLSQTILLGNYTGVFEDGKLVAMAGHRFHPAPYIEVSAVCTHPDYLGKGYAYEIIREQIRRILLKNQIPFLHVRQDNVGAIKLYEKLGFTIRTEMFAEVIGKY